ncbi:MAG: hypothetical protein FJ319_02370 [SAR202 cluster bacterium]|nr:hypothetical protein [SAR202 cluster bacterium]
MSDYQPLDISALCSSNMSAIGETGADGLGNQTMLGLPFLVGAPAAKDGDNCFIDLRGDSAPVTVPIRSRARNVVIAHRLLETSVPQGGLIGNHVADYVFRLADGSIETVKVRERFQISAINPPYHRPTYTGAPYLPFDAVRDTHDALMPRYEGRWDDMGNRQSEGLQGFSKRYFLWHWRNPKPDVEIESFTIVPVRQRFIIAAVTLGHADEDPFVLDARRAAKIVLKDPERAAKPFSVDVSVDRGVASYAFPLPLSTPDEFLADALKGWGEKDNETSSPSYVEVSATPSATVTVKQGDEVVGTVKWGDVVEQGIVDTPQVAVQLIDPGKNWVHVTVVDDETGRPIPCRVHFRSPEGVPFQPHGHHNQVNSNLNTFHNDIGGDARLGHITYAYIDGKCQGWLPRGDAIVDIARGYEYEPLRTKVHISPGQRELTLRLKRWTNMNRKGWYSGDSHVHFVSASGAHLESAAEDLNVVNLLQSQWGSLFTNTEDFTGGPSVSKDGRHIIYVGQENRQHLMAHMNLWGLKKPIMPWCSDGLGEAEIGGPLETVAACWADEAHAQGGWVVQPHFPTPNGESAALIATGRLDGIEMVRQTWFNHNEWYRYLNGGYRLPLVGGTDKMSSDVPVGLYRTYAKLPPDEQFTYEGWCKSVAAGRTFLSSGPMIGLAVEGQGIGETVRISGPGKVFVEAWAESIFPLHTLQIVNAGRVVAEASSKNGARRLELRQEIAVEKNTWLAARAGGPDYFGTISTALLSPSTPSLTHLDFFTRRIFAHTSPVYVACGGDWWMFDRNTARYMLTMIEGDIEYIRNRSVQHRHGSITHHHGEPDHMAYLQRPFHEARQAILDRMHRLGVTL